jgi:hypothetical protein
MPRAPPPGPPLDVDTTAIGGVGLTGFLLVFLWACYELLLRAIVWPCCVDGYCPRLHPDSSRTRVALVTCVGISAALNIPQYALLSTSAMYEEDGVMLPMHRDFWHSGRHVTMYDLRVFAAVFFFYALSLLLYTWSSELANATAGACLAPRPLLAANTVFTAIAIGFTLSWRTSTDRIQSSFDEPFLAAFSWLDVIKNLFVVSVGLVRVAAVCTKAKVRRHIASALLCPMPSRVLVPSCGTVPPRTDDASILALPCTGHRAWSVQQRYFEAAPAHAGLHRPAVLLPAACIYAWRQTSHRRALLRPRPAACHPLLLPLVRARQLPAPAHPAGGAAVLPARPPAS